MTTSPPTALVPLNLIRTDTVLARFPIHNLAKKGEVHIRVCPTFYTHGSLAI